MEKIKPGKYFELTYKLFRVNPDGSETLVHEVEADDPDCGILGVTPGFVPSLEEALDGLAAGDTFDFTATPERAFGPYDKEEIIALPRERFLIDGKFDARMFAPGSLVPLMTSDGYRIDGTVLELRPDEVVLDFNHPLAKDTVHYTGTVTLVRDPSEEELRPAGGCGCGCHCSDDGCGCSDDSCGCSDKNDDNNSCGCSQCH